MTIGWQWTLLQ